MDSNKSTDISSLLRTFFTPVRHFNDKWEQYPWKAPQWGYAISEALKPVYSQYSTPLTAATIGFIAISTFYRGEEAILRERHPEYIKKARVETAMNSLMTGWLESITFPSLFFGTMSRITPKLLSAGAPKWASLAISLSTLPIAIPLSTHLAEYTMNWTIRPFIQKLGEKFILEAYSKQYGQQDPTGILPMEDFLAEIDQSLESSFSNPYAGMVPPDLSALEQARLIWALDMNPSSPYPEDEDAANVTGASLAKSSFPAANSGLAGALAARSKKEPQPEQESTLSQEEQYMKAVNEILAKAAARAKAGPPESN